MLHRRKETAMATTATTYEEVRNILNELTDQGNPGNPFHDNKTRFWNDYAILISEDTKVYDEQPVVIIGDPEASPLIKALKGEAPFDGSLYPRMPQGRPPATQEQIDYISQWISDGCPE